MAQSPSSPRLSVTQVGPQTVEVVWPATPSPFELQRSHSIGAAADWRRIPLSPLARGDQLFVRVNIEGSASFYRLIEVKVPFAVANVAPTDGAGEVGVTYRPKIAFTRPANPRSITRDSFFAFAAGQPVQATVVPSGDGSFGWLFFAQPLPGGTRVRVVVDGELIQAAEDGSSLDADGDGRPGGVLEFEFTTVSRVSVPGTVLAGRVVDPGPDLAPRTLDDIGFGAQGLFFRRPIEGVKVFLLGMENQFVFTDSNGWFRLDPVPVGDVKVVLQGQTATTPHPGFYWPEMVMDSRNEPGITNTIQMIGRETNAIQLFLETVYLPRVMSNILQNVSSFQTNVITLQSNAMYDLPPEQQQHLRLEVMPNSLIGANGQPLFNAQVGISVVPPELVRDMLPPGLLQHTFDITVQAPGVATFSTPAPMTFPNVFNAAPGTRLNLLSFDHTTGRLVIEGTATVSADGLTVRTDPGTGITRPGWHGLAPPGGPNGPPEDPTILPTIEVDPVPLAVVTNKAIGTVDFGTEHLLFKNDGEEFLISVGNAAPNQGPVNGSATRLVVNLEVQGPTDLIADTPFDQTFELLPGEIKNIRVKIRDYAQAIKTDPIYDGNVSGDHLSFLTVSLVFGKRQTDGSVITIPTSQFPPLHVFRFVDAMDSNSEDGILEFAPTLNDGAGGIERKRRIHMAGNTEAEALSIQVGFLNIGSFKRVPAHPKVIELVFDPDQAAPGVHAPLSIVAPDGKHVLHSALSLKGDAVDKFAIHVNTAELADRLNQLRVFRGTSRPIAFRLILTHPMPDGGGTTFMVMDELASGGPISFLSTSDEVRSAFEALPAIGQGNISVSRTERQFSNDDALLHEITFTIIFQASYDGDPYPRIRHTGAAPIVTLAPIFHGGLITAGEVALFYTDAASTARAAEVANQLSLLFVDFTDAIRIQNGPGQNTIQVDWRHGGVPSRFGSSAVPGGGGIDRISALRSLVTTQAHLRPGIRAFLLSKALNQRYPANVEIYPNQVLMEYRTAPLELSREELVRSLAASAAHEVAHTLGAVHTAKATARTTISNEVQEVTQVGQLPPNSEIAFEFGGQRTAWLPPMATAAQIEDALQDLHIVEPEHMGLRYTRIFGAPGGPWRITFTGRLNGVDVPELQVVRKAAPDGSAVDLGFYQTVTTVQGLAHFSGRRVNIPGTHPTADLTATGILPYDPHFAFREEISTEILKIGLKMNWTLDDARKALRVLDLSPTVDALLHGLDGTDGAEFLIPTPQLLLETTNGLTNPLVLELGTLVLDGSGPGYAVPVTVRNSGGDVLVIDEVRVSTGDSFIEAELPNTTLQPGDETLLTLTVDPTVSGDFNGRIEISSSDPSGSYFLNVTGFAQSGDGDLRVIAESKNFGGVALDQQRAKPHFATIANIGGQALTVSAIRISAGETGNEYAITRFERVLPTTLLPGEKFLIDVTFRPITTGLRRGAIEIQSSDLETPVSRLHLIGTGLPRGGEPLTLLDYGNDFVAIDSPDFPNTPALRTTSASNGDFTFFLPPDQSYHATIFDPVSGLIAHLTGSTRPTGSGGSFGMPVFLASIAPDDDGDGLPNDIEFAIGTDPNAADTDRDGLDDFTEVTQRQNPVNGRPTATGVIGRIGVSTGRNLELHAPDPNNPAALHAYIAGGLGGLAIVDVSEPTTPSVIGSVTIVGGADDVAVDSETKLAVTAGQKVSLIDITDPARASLMQTLDFGGVEVEAANGLAFVLWRNPTNNALALRAIDLLAGNLRHELPLAIRSFSSMVRDANFLYLLGDAALHIVSVDSAGRMTLRGTNSVPAGFGRFSVANGVAYVPSQTGFNPSVPSGYSSIDVSDPDNPTLIQGPQAPTDTAPSLIATATGSGLLLLANNVNPGWDLFLMNASDPTNTYNLITRFRLDAVSQPDAIAIAGGYAFVVTRMGDLRVINYVGRDTRGQAPNISAVDIFPDADAVKSGPQISEGSTFYVRASLLDDVQVHSVELLINGQVVQRSLSVPFNLGDIAPTLAPDVSNIVVQVRATDTGGNSTLSEPVTVELVVDPVPRSLMELDPAEGERKDRGFKQARFLFSDSMGASATDTTNFQLLRGGTNELPITSAALSSRDRVLELNFEPLGPGDYELVVHAPNIFDRAGNALGETNFIRRFSVDHYSIRWIRGCTNFIDCSSTRESTGSWFQPTNWSPARVPGPEDWVLIDVYPTNVIYIISRPLQLYGSAVPQEVSVKALDCKAQLSLHYISLRVEQPFHLPNRISLNASRLTDMIALGEGSPLITFGGPVGLPYGVTPEGYTVAFDRVHLKGDFKLHTQLNVLNRLTLDGTLDGTGDRSLGELLAYGNVRFTRNAILDGSGTLTNVWVTMNDREGPFTGLDGRVTHFYRETNAVVSFEPGISVRGRVTMGISGDNYTFINRGRIIAEIPHEGSPATRGDSDIRMAREFGAAWTMQILNEGLIEARNQDRLLIGTGGSGVGTVINRGTLRSTSGAYLLFSGDLVSSRIICDPGAYFELADGSLRTRPDQVSELSGAGFWLTEAMEFIGGTVRLVDGAVVEGDATFNNVTFEGELRNYDWQFRRHELPPFLTGYGNIIQVRSNLTLNGTIAFRRALTNFPGYLVAASGQSQTRIDGVGRLVFERANNWHVVGRQGTLDVGSGITIEAGGVLFGTADPGSLNRGIRSAGTILADRPDSAIYANAFVFTNAGTIRLGSGIIFTNQYSYRQTAEGQLLIHAGGTQPGITHGQVKSFSSLALDGELVLQSESDYEPTAGDALELARGWVSRTGQFASITTATPPAGLEWLPQYGPTNFVLRLVLAAAPVQTSTTSGPDNSITAERDSTPLGSSTSAATAARPHSIAREWNEQNLAAIRVDTPHPPVHARNLFSLSVCMYDAWAAYDSNAVGYIYRRKHTAEDVAAARREAISHAAYRMLRERYYYSRSSNITAGVLSAFMSSLGYRTNDFATNTAVASGVGNSVYLAVSNWFIVDGSRQLQAYADYPLAQGGYTYINPMLATSIPGIDDGGGRTVVDINRWQRLMIVNAVDQNGFPVGPIQNYLGPQWLRVRPFALERVDPTKPWIDPGPPPFFGTDSHAAFVSNVVEVIRRSSELTPDDGATIDISPGALGNNSLGLNNGTGHPVNPATGQPYPANVVKRGDFARVLAEFWADGPNSETPPGHWNTLANAMTHHPSFERRISGTGPLLDQLEWDVKMYFALNAALHEAACAAWSIKRYYDAWRPISAVRYLASLGQSTDPTAPLYHTNGLPLIDGLIELVTEASTDGRHAGLMPGTIAVLAWPGQPPINAPPQYQGVKWIAGDSWVPYQKANFVTPAFPGYVSGHSTFSRAAAEVLTELTGSPFFPGGMAAYTAQANTTLTFEQGPSATIELQWGTYYDAADQAGLSRIWGGIHPPADDFAGRRVGSGTGKAVWKLARKYFNGSVMDEPIALNIRRLGNNSVVLSFNTLRGFHYHVESCPEAGRSFVGEGTSTLAHDSFLVRTNTSLTPTKVFRAVREPR